MKIQNLILTAVLLFGAWFYFHARRPAPAEPVREPAPIFAVEAPAPTVTPKVSTDRSPEPHLSAKAPAPPKVEIPESAGDEAEPNIVEFKLEDGLAVAFGDLVLGVPEGGMKGTVGRAQIPTPKFWLHQEIAYSIDPALPNPERVREAVDYFVQNTEIPFVPATNQKDGIVFTVGKRACKSYIGKIGGFQPVWLDASCGPREIIHELMHALGFIHEQSRTDRDQFVEILWDNIEPQFKDQFAVVPEVLMENYRNTGFDYESIMLYDPSIFSLGGRPTLRSITNNSVQPVRMGLSAKDLERLRALYGSGAAPARSPAQPQ